MPNIRESRVEEYLGGRAEAAGGFSIKLNPLWYVGIPDRLLLLPGGRAIFVETKTTGGHISAMQSSWHMQLRKLGFHVYVLWTYEQVDGFFERYAKT
jgi:hypothetical protein